MRDTLNRIISNEVILWEITVVLRETLRLIINDEVYKDSEKIKRQWFKSIKVNIRYSLPLNFYNIIQKGIIKFRCGAL